MLLHTTIPWCVLFSTVEDLSSGLSALGQTVSASSLRRFTMTVRFFPDRLFRLHPIV